METIIDKLNKIYEQKTQLKECMANMGVETSSFNEFSEKLMDNQNEVRESLNNILGIDFENPVSLCTTVAIDCWGDSLTNGDGGNVSAYPTTLKYLLKDENPGLSVNNFGIGGTTSQYIAIRQGGLVADVKQTTIKSEGRTQIKFALLDGENVSILNNTSVDTFKLQINPCTINEISGTLLRSEDNSQYLFTPIGLTADYEMSSDAPLITYGAVNDSIATHIPIIWIGTNDWKMPDERMLEIAENMVKISQSGKYIVIGLISTVGAYTRTNMKKLDECNAKFTAAFGDNFIDMHKEIMENGLQWIEDLGLEITQTDRDDIASGITPLSLRSSASDKTHLNKYGYYCIGKVVYNRGKELGYWR